MSSSQQDRSTAATISRLITGEPSKVLGYLDEFFQGKNPETRRRGALALLAIMEQGACKSDQVPMLMRYVLGMREETPNLPIQETINGIIRRVLSKVDANASCPRPEITLLNPLLDLDERRYAPNARFVIESMVIEHVLRPSVWLDIHQQLGWMMQSGSARGEDPSAGSGFNLAESFRTQCLGASYLYASRGEYGVAAALYTLSNREGGHGERYRLARDARQPVALNCVMTGRLHGDLSLASLHGKPLSSPSDLLQELFGPNYRQHKDCVEPGQFWSPVIQDQGGTLVLNDPFAQIVSDRLLSQGRWGDAQRVMRSTRRERDIGSIVLLAMYTAHRDGRNEVAAALGQIALASHARGEAGSMIVQFACSVAEAVYGEHQRSIKESISQYTDPSAEIGAFGEFSAPSPKSVPRELEDAQNKVNAERAAFQRLRIQQTIRDIEKFFGTVIELDIPLRLEMF